MKASHLAFLILSAGGMTAVAQSATVNGASATTESTATQAGSSTVSGTASGSSATQATAQSSAVTDRYLTPVQTELTGKVDSKSAVVGQEVMAKTSQATKLADGTALPKGTKLVGHVTEVQAHSKGEAGAILGLSFDKAELKGGQTLALRGVMQAVAPPVAMASNDSMGLDQAGPIGGAGSMSAPMGGAASGSTGTRGGLGGGGLAAPVRSVGQTAGSTVGGVAGDTRMAGQTAMDTTGRTVATAGESVSGAAHATSLPGVLLSSSGSVSGAANSSGRLTASGKNISLESGTRITLGVIAR
jgi:hypothetical protein